MNNILAAKVLIVVGDEGLVLRNSDTHPRWPLMGDLPGGTVEEGETVEDGLIREVFEETSVTLEVSDVEELHAMTKANEEVNVTYHFFGCRLNEKPAITLSFEHDQYHWVKLSDISGVEQPYQDGIVHALKFGLI